MVFDKRYFKCSFTEQAFYFEIFYIVVKFLENFTTIEISLKIMKLITYLFIILRFIC